MAMLNVGPLPWPNPTAGPKRNAVPNATPITPPVSGVHGPSLNFTAERTSLYVSCEATLAKVATDVERVCTLKAWELWQASCEGVIALSGLPARLPSGVPKVVALHCMLEPGLPCSQA